MAAPPVLPLHPVVVHFPIAGVFFAAFALALALVRPAGRKACMTSGALLLGATVLGGLVAAATGWDWADDLAYLAGGWGPIPGPKAVEGLARRHALLALAGLAAAAVALALTLLARRKEGSPLAPFVATLVACALIGLAGHVGGTMVHAPPPPVEEGAPAS